MTAGPIDRKRAVRDYFDREAEGYAKAYHGSIDDARTYTFVERRSRSLEMLREPLGRVLDVGAGPGVFTRALIERGATCWGIDLSHDMMIGARRALPPELACRAAFIVGDIERLPFGDAAFDTVVCVGVLQYLEAAEPAVAELARVTRSGGQILVTFPNRQSPLNRLHGAAVALARAAVSGLRWAGITVRPSTSRLTFREDVVNRAFNLREIERWASTVGLRIEFTTYHLLLFPFSIPGFGPLLRAWNRFFSRRMPRGPFVSWGREGIVRLSRA